MEEYGKRWVAIEQKLTEDALKNSSPEARKAILNQIRNMAEELGFSYDEMVEKATKATSKMQEQSTMWAQTTKDASEAQRTANTQWNAMVWDLKEGKLKTNAVEEVQKALQAEGGWDSMQFILKEANLTSNARLTIGEALVANGQWESLSPSEKALVVNNQPAIAAILESKELLSTWDGLPSDVKEILGRNEGFMGSAEAATNALNTWNSLLPAEKEIVARDLASPVAEVVQGAIDRLTGKSVQIEAQDATEAAIQSAIAGIGSVQQTAPASIEAINNTMEQVMSAQSTMDSLQDVTRALHGENLTQPEKDAAQATLDSLTDVTRQIMATNLTGSEKAAAQATLDSLQDVKRSLKGENLTQDAKNKAQSTLDSLKDVKRALNAEDRTASGVNSAIATMSSVPNITRYIDIITRRSEHAKGTNFHPGGLALVNDQRGTLYKEMVTLPDGTSFIPQGRNVTLPLPRGSKVLKAGLTRNLMNSLGISKYADGIGFENTKIAHLTRRIKDVNEHSAQYDDRRLVQLVSELVRLSGNKKPDPTQAGDVSYTLNLNGSGREDFFTPENMKRLMRELAYYTNGEGGRLA